MFLSISKKEDHMEALQRRLEALEQEREQLKHHPQALEAHTHAVEQRLRWWRRIACGLGVLCLLGQPLVSGTAQYCTTEHVKGLAHRVERLAQRIEELEEKLVHIQVGGRR